MANPSQAPESKIKDFHKEYEDHPDCYRDKLVGYNQIAFDHSQELSFPVWDRGR